MGTAQIIQFPRKIDLISPYEVDRAAAVYEPPKRILEKLTGEKTATRQNIEALAETYSPYVREMLGDAAGVNFNIGIQELSASEFKKNDANAQKIGGRFNRELLPLLAGISEPSHEIIQLISDLNEEHYDATKRWWKESGNNVGPSEFERLNSRIDSLLRGLDRLRGAIDELSSDGIPIHGEIEGTLD
jgi:hypothetical protein